MIRALPLLPLLAACGSDKPPPADPPKREVRAPATAPAEPSPATAAAEAGESEDAAAVLRRYYRLIDERNYEQAAGLRSRRGAGDAARLADTFRAYRTYKVQVGKPGRPARSGAWLFVTVPVMITGSFVGGGETFGSAGSVTMRRAASDETRAEDRGWRIYTG